MAKQRKFTRQEIELDQAVLDEIEAVDAEARRLQQPVRQLAQRVVLIGKALEAASADWDDPDGDGWRWVEKTTGYGAVVELIGHMTADLEEAFGGTPTEIAAWAERLLGVNEIARRLDVHPKTIHLWRRRFPDTFPAPALDLDKALAWNWPDVERWVAQSGRKRNGRKKQDTPNPASAKKAAQKGTTR